MDPIGTVMSFIGGIGDALRSSPGGFGLILVPLVVLWIIVVAVSRRR
jgi:hypothetical protein